MTLHVLLLGDGGMLAHDLVTEVPEGVTLVTRTENDLDITTAAVEREIEQGKPDVVLNAAGYASVDRAESETELAYAVNGEALGRIGAAATRAGSLVVHYSTDYVFSGESNHPYREDDNTNPLGVYGSSKLDGELRLAAGGARHLIIRTQWLFGLHGHSFPRTMWNRARAGQPTRVVDDQHGKPTYTVDLARATWRLIGTGTAVETEDAGAANAAGATGAQGIVHIANSGQTTWYSLAKRIFETAGVPELLSSCTTADYPTPALRPKQSVLDTGLYERLTGTALPRWEDAVSRFLEII